jgi:hypothetical protein
VPGGGGRAAGTCWIRAANGATKRAARPEQLLLTSMLSGGARSLSVRGSVGAGTVDFREGVEVITIGPRLTSWSRLVK